MSTPASPSAIATVRLPIHTETHAGLGEAGGMLGFDGGELTVEFQTRDALFGLLRGPPKALRVPLHAIESVRCGAGWFWLMPWIEVTLNDFRLLTELPGAEGGRWRARVRFADRAALRRFAQALGFARAESLHTRLTEGLPQRTDDAPPVAPPIAPPLPPPAARRRERE